MRPAPRYDELDRLVESARAMEPAPLSELEARRLVRNALTSVHTTPAPRRSRRSWYWALAAVMVFGFVALRAAWPSGTMLSVAEQDPPLRIALLAGDAVTMAPGAKLELQSQTPQRRLIQLTRGTALFDVVKLEPGECFEVVTAHGSVQVKGTVFSVEAQEGRTVVRVYEGRVQVGPQTLAAGSTWTSRGQSDVGSDPLAAQAATAVQARQVAAKAPVQAPPSPQTSPLGVEPAEVVAAQVTTEGPPTTEAPPAQRTHTDDAGTAETAPTPGLERARHLLAQGKSLEALTLARAALQKGPGTDVLSWRRVEADALRALGRFNEAVVSYELGATQAESTERKQFAYDAAALDLEGLRDPASALVLIDRWQLDAHDSQLRERAGRLRVHALLALGRMEEARAAARRYLAIEPETAVSEEMRRLLGW